MGRPKDEEYTPDEAAQRLRGILRGAFRGVPATPLKALPKKDGKSRSTATKKSGSSVASAKNARPKT